MVCHVVIRYLRAFREIFGWVRITYYRGAYSRLVKQMGRRLLLNATSSPLLLKVFHVLRASDGMSDTLDRLKVLINSSTPIVVMETSEEMRAVGMVRTACSELNMATFEWSIADGLIRQSTHPSDLQVQNRVCEVRETRATLQAKTALSPGSGESERLIRAVMSSAGVETPASGGSIYNTREPVQALANMEAMTIQAVFILKDFIATWMIPWWCGGSATLGKNSSSNRRTVIITAPELAVPAELTDTRRTLRSSITRSRPPAGIVHEIFTRLSTTYTLKLSAGCRRSRRHCCKPSRAHRRRGGPRHLAGACHKICVVF